MLRWNIFYLKNRNFASLFFWRKNGSFWWTEGVVCTNYRPFWATPSPLQFSGIAFPCLQQPVKLAKRQSVKQRGSRWINWLQSQKAEFLVSALFSARNIIASGFWNGIGFTSTRQVPHTPPPAQLRRTLSCGSREQQWKRLRVCLAHFIQKILGFNHHFTESN